MNHPTVTLSNGLRVTNFSSPHSFTFTTGEVLPACDPEVSKALSLDIVETEVTRPDQKWTDIVLGIAMTPHVLKALEKLGENEDVDVIIVPLMVRQALTNYAGRFPSHLTLVNKVRCVRSADRVTKAIYPDRFCT